MNKNNNMDLISKVAELIFFICVYTWFYFYYLEDKIFAPITSQDPFYKYVTMINEHPEYLIGIFITVLYTMIATRF
ncbi:hypothetical protein nvc1_069 [Namao virus]|nr:hypothetical protein nvc1_069 [Namao virus]